MPILDSTRTVECAALRARLLEVARRLASECGPDVTLSEIVHHAQRPAGVSRQRSLGDEAIVATLLEQRLGDLAEVVRSAADPQHRPETSATWTRAVRELLSDELDRPALSLQAAGRALAVSVRTLQRRLADEGTSWRAEIDAARRERAARLLQRGVTADVAAAHVGFSGGRALRRAMRRWDRDAG
jgi:AraC-like DNA-binding protein